MFILFPDLAVIIACTSLPSSLQGPGQVQTGIGASLPQVD